MNPLTGRRRYRQTVHGLILEVEYCYYEYDTPRWRCAWRDADVYDVTGLEIAS